MVERLIALCEAHGCGDLEGLRADVEVVIRVEFLAHQRAIRSTEERWRRRLDRGAGMPTGTQP